jgi:hypothetical protein
VRCEFSRLDFLATTTTHPFFSIFRQGSETKDNNRNHEWCHRSRCGRKLTTIPFLFWSIRLEGFDAWSFSVDLSLDLSSEQRQDRAWIIRIIGAMGLELWNIDREDVQEDEDFGLEVQTWNMAYGSQWWRVLHNYLSLGKIEKREREGGRTTVLMLLVWMGKNHKRC